MALELKYKYILNKQADQLIVQDTTNAYSASNLGGWGVPNTERNSVALVSYLRYQGYNKPLENISFQHPENSVLYNDSYLNSEVSDFIYPYTKDGWYKAALIAVPVENNAPEELDIIYSIPDVKLQIYKEDEWADLTSEDWEQLLNTEKYDLVDNQDILMGKIVLVRNCLTEQYIDCLQCTSCKCDTQKENLVQMNLYIQAADYRFYSGKEFEGQRMVEKIGVMFKCKC